MESDSLMSDTGFPEPFCRLRNTTLRHPDAKSGDDAFLGFDVPSGTAQRRQFGQKHKHAISWGSLDTEDNASSFASEFDLSPTMGLRRLVRARALTSGRGPASPSSAASPGDLTDGELSSHHRANSVESSDTAPDDMDESTRPKFLQRKRTIFNAIRRTSSRRQTAGTQVSTFE